MGRELVSLFLEGFWSESSGWWPPNGFNLQYATNCGSAKNCSPFGDSDLGFPNIVFINGFGCLNKERKLRVLVEFTKSSSSGFYQPFYPNTTLVGEGYWNETKLSVVACRFLDVVGSLADARIADCSTRLSLIFSSALSIRETSNVAGEMWTDKTVNDFGFFDRILFRNSENRVVDIPELKYEYTQMERVRQLCLKTELVKSSQVKYPIGNSIHMRFDMSVSNSHGKIASGYALPFNVGAQFYKKLLDEVSANSADDAKFNRTVNMSYKIGLSVMPDIKIGEGISLFTSTSLFNEVEISAEGVYNEKSGGLCMVGCRNLELDNQTDTGKSFDCEILLKFQFSPLEEIKNEGYIKGIIESLREKSDPFYFEPLEAHSTGYNIIQARQFIWRMDMEIAIAIISCTLASFFAVLQHLHLKRRPEMLPLISIVMLIILTLGYLMPFVMNLSSFFLQDGFLQVNEVTINLLKTVAFAFQFRLLRITWIARVRDERHKGMKLVEKNTSLLLIAIYGFEALIGFIVNDRLELKTYGEVISDGFLLPQILLNFLSNSKENVLACSFYMGNTFLQLLPHLYNLYDAYTYFYRVSPLDVIIVFGDLLFAAIIFLQQNKRSRAGMRRLPLLPVFRPNGHRYRRVRARTSRAQQDEHSCGCSSRDESLHRGESRVTGFGVARRYFSAIPAVTGNDNLHEGL
ncbi:hypothetical protein JCGZ_20990 [Jatropha curcas]|uniref:RING-type E3 ubiquitin transferase n=1 Tax=Jatropha curcas TaxID=180498 RepID=A0A067K476_JATCU|nr:hypothetical protein JCGZ_20990 [Jatropha curcas]